MIDHIFELFLKSHSVTSNAECLVQITSYAVERIKLQKAVSLFINKITTPSIARTLVLAIDECINNAYEHGNLELSNVEKNQLLTEEKLESELHSRESKFGDRIITVKFSLVDNILKTSISDEGNGFDWKNQSSTPPQDALHGRGISIVRAVFDKLTFNEIGNSVCLEKKLPPALSIE